ncbi:exonuclease domain-containing protein [Actinokineospora enzanensis]|uniref:exonuclease domain-containing protein n=1 Tax=Actinokineospora enzanensis TaxID=155975 RepID=UPI000371C170|nr:exonuclease domain-containing protein [Actinokineospora enzanensis]
MTQTWADGPMVAFDTETTGPDPETARIVTAALVSVGPGAGTSSYLLNPEVEIPQGATDVHGITTEHARQHGESPADIVPVLVAELAEHVEAGRPIVIYNAPFDLTVLARECVRYGHKTLHEVCAADGLLPWIVDPFVLDRALDRYRRGSRKLVDVARHYRVPLSDGDAHTSGGDALAAARVAWRIARTHPKVGAMGRDELMAYQARAYADWADGFAGYLARQGKAESISREWPVRAVSHG